MILTSGQHVTVAQGDYALIGKVTSGEVTMAISVDGENFVDVEDGNFTADFTRIIQLPACRIQHVATGTAVVQLTKSRGFGN